MNLRPLAVVAIALSCALATPSTAGGNVSLDGVRRTEAVVRGEVTQPAFVASERLVDPLEPTMKECGAASCDVTTVTLTLPKGSTSGRFRAVVRMPRALNGYIALYNREGERVARADMLQNGTICCETESTYQQWKTQFVVPRLTAGVYKFVVFDRGGIGEFEADLTFTANPPDRQTPGKRGQAA